MTTPLGEVVIQYGYAIIIRVHYQKCIKNTSNSNMASPTDTNREMYLQHHHFFVLPLLLSCVYFNNYLVESFCSAPQEELLVKYVENLTINSEVINNI